MSNNRSILSSLTVALFILCCLRPCSAQYTTASVSGTVTDPSGAPVAGAKVTAQNTDTGLKRSSLRKIMGLLRFQHSPLEDIN